MKVFNVIVLILFGSIYSYAQETTSLKEQEVEIPSWYTKLDTLNVKSISQPEILQFLDTINYRVLGNEQIAILNDKIEKLKARYVAVHGTFPIIYPKTNLYISNLHCDQSAKMVIKILNIESTVIKVLNVDLNDKLVTFSYPENLKDKEDEKLYPHLIAKLKSYDYFAMSEEASTDPGQLGNTESYLLNCPFHENIPVQNKIDEDSENEIIKPIEPENK